MGTLYRSCLRLIEDLAGSENIIALSRECLHNVRRRRIEFIVRYLPNEYAEPALVKESHLETDPVRQNRSVDQKNYRYVYGSGLVPFLKLT